MFKSCVLFFCSILNADSCVVHLTPPTISSEVIQDRIICTRPGRKESFNLSLEEKEGKTVVHCYGFGTAGWSCLFGAVQQAVYLFEQTHPSKEVPVRIIGGGCFGLTCALELSSLGYKVSGISTKQLYDTASWRAGALFDIPFPQVTPDEQAHLQDLAVSTFLTYRDIENGKHPYLPSDTVRFLPVYISKHRGKGLLLLENMCLIPPRADVILDFGNGVTHTGYAVTYVYYIDPGVAMQRLLKEIEARKIPIEIQEIAAFNDISESIIFNCAGLGNYTLNQDPAVFPLYGHVVLLSPPNPTDYVLATIVTQNGKEEALHYFPKTVSVIAQHPKGVACGGFLGGTYISPEQVRNDEDEFSNLLDRASLFFYGVPLKSSSI